MPPHRINIYADRQGVNESLQKRERSKTTELRPSNEDLGKNTANLLIVWQAVRAPAPFSPSLYTIYLFLKCKQAEQCGLQGGDHIARLWLQYGAKYLYSSRRNDNVLDFWSKSCSREAHHSPTDFQ